MYTGLVVCTCRLKLGKTHVPIGNMTGVPKGLAWIAKDDVPTPAEFKVVKCPASVNIAI